MSRSSLTPSPISGADMNVLTRHFGSSHSWIQSTFSTQGLPLGDAARLLVLAIVASHLIACSEAEEVDYSGPVADWSDFGGGDHGLRDSPLTQLDGNALE